MPCLSFVERNEILRNTQRRANSASDFADIHVSRPTWFQPKQCYRNPSANKSHR
jgi:hypothetical protein